MLILMMVLYGLFGLLGILVLAPNTFPGADLAVFQQAGQDLVNSGNPYLSNETAHYNFQYRYPPLLAMVIPLLGWPPLWYALLVGIDGHRLLLLVGGRRMVRPAADRDAGRGVGAGAHQRQRAADPHAAPGAHPSL